MIYYEASAKTGLNVDHIFEDMAGKIYSYIETNSIDYTNDVFFELQMIVVIRTLESNWVISIQILRGWMIRPRNKQIRLLRMVAVEVVVATTKKFILLQYYIARVFFRNQHVKKK